MDITKITDIKELKAMAYDQSVTLQVAQTNLQLIQQRIAELEQEKSEQKNKK